MHANLSLLVVLFSLYATASIETLKISVFVVVFPKGG